MVGGKSSLDMSAARGPLTLIAWWSLSSPGRNDFHIQSYPIVLLIIEESQHVESIIVLSRVAVLRGQPIVNGNDDRRDFARKSAANCIVLLGVGAEVHEAAAVEEDDYGEGSGIPRLVARGDEDTEPEVAGRVEGDVGGLDAVDRVAVGGSSDVEYLEETAVHGAILAARGVGHGGDQGKGYAGPPWNGGLMLDLRRILNLIFCFHSYNKIQYNRVFFSYRI
nr:Os07g0643500 [Ipomoea batatas]